MEAIILEQLLLRTSGISSPGPAVSATCLRPGVWTRWSASRDKHKWHLRWVDWQMERYRRLLVAAQQKFLGPLQEATSAVSKGHLPSAHAGFSWAGLCLLLPFPSDLSRGPQICVLEWMNVYISFLSLIIKLSQSGKWPTCKRLPVSAASLPGFLRSHNFATCGKLYLWDATFIATDDMRGSMGVCVLLCFVLLWMVFSVFFCFVFWGGYFF